MGPVTSMLLVLQVVVHASLEEDQVDVEGEAIKEAQAVIPEVFSMGHIHVPKELRDECVQLPEFVELTCVCEDWSVVPQHFYEPAGPSEIQNVINQVKPQCLEDQEGPYAFVVNLADQDELGSNASHVICTWQL